VPKNYAAISQPVPSPVNEVRLKSDKKNGKERVYKINPKPWTYVMAEGFTVTRNLYIDTIITKFNVEMPLRMDVIHPFNSKHPVPALLAVSSSAMKPKGRNGRLNHSSPFSFTWTLYGYGAAIMDNVPNMRDSVPYPYYGEVPSVPYGPYFPEKRALRTLRAHKEELQLTGKVIICGISKTARRAAAAAFINEDVSDQPSRWADYPLDRNKKRQFAAERGCIKYVQKKLKGKLIGEKDKGPHADQSDRFDGIYFIPTDAMGMGTKSEEQIGFVDKNDPPAYITQQDHNRQGQESIEKAVQQCKKAGLRFKASDPICQPGLDHNYNMHKIDEMIEFFNSVISDGKK
jgi:hypothetical protein